MDPRNPHIESFLRTLIERKEKKLEPDELERLVESLNRLFENMVGRNMIAALPEDVRRDFVSRYDKGSRDVDPAQLSPVFDAYIDDPAKIMKDTLREFADLYFRTGKTKSIVPQPSGEPARHIYEGPQRPGEVLVPVVDEVEGLAHLHLGKRLCLKGTGLDLPLYRVLGQDAYSGPALHHFLYGGGACRFHDDQRGRSFSF